MGLTKQQNFAYVASIIGICILSWVVQATIYVNPDIRWLVMAASRLLEGGSYAKNFFEPNPPLILYLYSPVVILMKAFSISLGNALRTYIFGLALFSFYICQRYCRAIFHSDHVFVTYMFAIAVLVVLLMLPVMEFGQREHLLVILSLPYFLLVSCRLMGKSVNSCWAAIVGLMAGIGFALKPNFMAAFVFVEIYYLVHVRRLTANIRVETLMIMSVFLLYLVVVLLFHYDYIAIVVPYVLHYYYQGYASTYGQLFNYPLFLVSFFPIILCFVLQKNNPYKQLARVLMLAFLGFLLSYITQHKVLYYYLLPMYLISILLLVMQLSLLIVTKKITQRDYVALIVIDILAVVFFCCYYKALWTIIIFFPLAYYCFFAGLFFAIYIGVFSLNKFFKSLLTVVIIMAIVVCLAVMAAQTSLYFHRFSITLALLFTLFFLFIPEKTASKFKYTFIALQGMLFLIYPLIFTVNIYQEFAAYKENDRNSLSEFLQKNIHNKSAYFFSTSAYPFTTDDEVKLVSRFDFFWMLPGMLKNPKTNDSDRNTLINMVADDLKIEKPDFVFVDVRHKKRFLNDIKFDYLPFFLKNMNFLSEWKDYHYLATVVSNVRLFDTEPLHVFQVYERNDENRGKG